MTHHRQKETRASRGLLTVVSAAIFTCSGCGRPHEPTAKPPPPSLPAEALSDDAVNLEELSEPGSAPREEPVVTDRESERRSAPAKRTRPDRFGSAGPRAAAVAERPAPSKALGRARKAASASKSQNLLLQEKLEKEQTQLQRSLNPTQLSCEGARPHRDMICEIAARLCESQSEDLLSQRQCQRAQAACDAAQKSFSERCGS